MRFSIAIVTILLGMSFSATAQEDDGDRAPNTATEPVIAPVPDQESTEATSAGEAAITGPYTEPTDAPPTDAPVGTVMQVFRDKRQVMVKLNRAGKRASSLSRITVSTGPGDTCDAEVLNKKTDRMLLGLADCDDIAKVKNGTHVLANISGGDPQPARTQAAPGAPPAPAPADDDDEDENRLRGVVHVGFHAGNEASFASSSAATPGTTASGKGKMELERALRVGVGVLKIPRNNWGFYAGFLAETRREITGANVTGGGGTVTVTYADPKPKLELSLIEVNAHYRWDRFYVPFGLNYSLTNFTPAPGTTETTDISGFVGGQLGVGYFIHKHVNIEAYWQQMGFKADSRDGATTVGLGTGSLPGVAVRAGFVF